MRKIQSFFKFILYNGIFFLFLCFCGITIQAQGLGDWATKAGLNYGTMVHKAEFLSATDSSIYRQTLRDECNMAFPENEIKWNAIEPTQGVFSFTYPDQVIAFAQANKMKSRGHFMVWHTNLPTWLTSRATGTNAWTRQQLLDILKNHINTVMGHYKGKITEYDVVNEPFYLTDKKSYGLRASMWYNIIGLEYIDSAFVWAHRADPQAYLYLNEYGAEMEISTGKPKSDSLYNFVKKMLSRGVPIHGVGLESHFGNWIDANGISANMKRLGDLGLRVSITELDMMNTTNLPQYWTGLMNATLANYNSTSFVTWGIDDKNSWKGKTCGCLVWDTLFQKKQVIYDGLITALKNANPTIAAKRKIFAEQPPYPQTALPIVTPEISYCQGETAIPLTATGTSLKWYRNATTNTVMPQPTPSTQNVGTTSYFVTQTLNYIESRKSEIKVTITAPIIWYQDLNGNGIGNPLVTIVSCSQPAGYVKDSSTGIFEKNADNSKFITYPQPFTKFTVIKLASEELIKTVAIMNVSGAIVESVNNLNSFQIPVGESLVSGIYFVVIKTRSNTFKTKIIKL